MIITVTAPKKGLGQTVTAINVAAVCNSFFNKEVLLIDIDRHCRGIEYFLSDTSTTRGLDEFIGLYQAGILTEKSFGRCVKRVAEKMDMMAANDCLEITEGVIQCLTKYSSAMYETTVIDFAGGNYKCSRQLLKQSDMILVVLGQSRSVLEMVVQNGLYKEFGEKVIFVLNKHMSMYEGKKIRYSFQEVENELTNAGFSASVFPLAYETDIVNECNDHSVLNIVFNVKESNILYNSQLLRLVQHIMDRDREGDGDKRVFGPIRSRRNKLFGLL